MTALRNFYAVMHSSGFHNKFPANQSMVIKYIVHCANNHCAPSTIASRLSAVAFVHKLLEKPDPTQSFLVKKLLMGWQKISGRVDVRLPILKKQLHQLVASLPHVGVSEYHRVMLKASYLLAFHAFLRPGEFTKSQSSSHLLQLSDVQFISKKGKPQKIIIQFRSFKHSSSSHPVSLSIRANHTSMCPVRALLEYVAVRGAVPGPLFVFPDNSPITRNYFSNQLKLSVAWSSLPTNIQPHSFRIGAATSAAISGVPHDQIKLMGRWKSDAFRRYIRVNTSN